MAGRALLMWVLTVAAWVLVLLASVALWTEHYGWAVAGFWTAAVLGFVASVLPLERL